jgi:hypothetical protein
LSSASPRCFSPFSCRHALSSSLGRVIQAHSWVLQTVIIHTYPTRLQASNLAFSLPQCAEGYHPVVIKRQKNYFNINMLSDITAQMSANGDISFIQI